MTFDASKIKAEVTDQVFVFPSHWRLRLNFRKFCVYLSLTLIVIEVNWNLICLHKGHIGFHLVIELPGLVYIWLDC